MKALRFHASKDLRVEDVDGPSACGPHEVLLKNSYCGIYGTDLHEYLHGPKDLTFRGSWAYKNTAWPRVISMAASGKLPVQKAISGKVKLENAVEQGFDGLTDPNSAHLKILIEVPS